MIPDEVKYDGAIDTVIGSTEIGEDGKYSFEKLALTRYTLFAISNTYTGTTSTLLSKERAKSERNLTLYEEAMTSGVVTDSSGNGIPDANVFVARYLSGGNDLKADVYRSRGSGVGADGDGSFTIGNL